MFRNRLNLFARFDADGTPGGDGGSGGNDDGTVGFQKLLDRYGNDAMRMAETLHRENYQYRQEIKQLERQVTDMQGKLPTDGALVLTGDDVAAYEGYKALGDVQTVKQGLDTAKDLQGKLAGLERAETLRTVAQHAHYKPAVLAQLDRMAQAAGKELAFEVREVEQDGEKVQLAFVRDGEAEQPLTEYAAAEWADFLPALQPQPAPQGGNGVVQPPVPAPGVRYPPQHTGGNGAKPKNVAEQFEAEQRERNSAIKNPLLP